MELIFCLFRERIAVIKKIVAETTRNKKGISVKEAANIPAIKATASQAKGALILFVSILVFLFCFSVLW